PVSTVPRVPSRWHSKKLAYRISKSPGRFVSSRTPTVSGTTSGGSKSPPPQGTNSLYRYEIDYTDAAGGRGGIVSQFFESLLTEEAFLDEIAPARTFLLESEAQQLRAAGLCQRVQYGDVLVFGQDGPIGNRLLWENECARHKVLDMIGDFSLADTPILGTFRARRTGHSQNAAALRELLKILDQQ
ncbi:MAG: UDP-3-O-acyl-N-acetylglucosamine deacetylase, partial [Thermoguttaceae bacterium]|nr:UDP-3-O-acyl-N-acetylglucosamine deacetylase [Thermoguttaceae bacterium]